MHNVQHPSSELDLPQNKKVAAAQEQKMKKGILTDANYSLNGNDTIVRYFWVDRYVYSLTENSSRIIAPYHKGVYDSVCIGEVLLTCQWPQRCPTTGASSRGTFSTPQRQEGSHRRWPPGPCPVIWRLHRLRRVGCSSEEISIWI